MRIKAKKKNKFTFAQCDTGGKIIKALDSGSEIPLCLCMD
jgi:hypothetical protein